LAGGSHKRTVVEPPVAGRFAQRYPLVPFSAHNHHLLVRKILSSLLDFIVLPGKEKKKDAHSAVVPTKNGIIDKE
jgi:DNA-binding transcriptional LysR family regulator